MRVLNAIFAVIVGLACWGISAALVGGVAPMGKSGGTEGLLFLMPVVIFATPIALLALIRGHLGTALWLGALAPILGFCNFMLAVGANTGGSAADQPSSRTLLALTAGWIVLSAVGILAIRALKDVEA
jgi:hypothetical protein